MRDEYSGGPRVATSFIALLVATLSVSVINVAQAATLKDEFLGYLLLLPVLPLLFGGRWVVRRSRAADIYEIWYGTNRADFIPHKLTYSDELARRVEYGRCKVAIPKSHKFGSTGSNKFRRWARRLFSTTDDRLSVIDVERCSVDQFTLGVRDTLEGYGPNEKIVLIYIHGYNTTFHDGAIRAAQIGFDLKIPLTAFYSWPSQGDFKLSAYLKDADKVAASERYIAEFISNIAKATPHSRINLIAHSMGNLGLLRALTSAANRAALDGIRFSQIFLAAPDIDIDLFRELADIYPTISERTTLYVSACDHALGISNRVHQNQRTGYSPPVTTIEGIDTVEATDVDVGILGHGYYAEAEGVLYDMSSLIRSDERPDKRIRLHRQQSGEGKSYWTIRGN
jgi:esterase/lipase superfamily enzyme